VTLSQEALKDLPPKQRAIADYMLKNPMVSVGLSVEQLAEIIGVNPSTIVRFAKRLKFKGYGHLRQSLRHQYLSTLEPLGVLEAHSNTMGNSSHFKAQFNQDISNLQTVMSTVDETQLDAVVKAVSQARSTLVVSAGSYASLALVFSHQCKFIGYDVEMESRGGSYLAHRLASLTSDDLLLGITFWKGSREVVQAVRWASRKGIPTAALTDSPFSSIAQAARIPLVIPTESTSYFQSLTASLSVVYGLLTGLWMERPERSRELASSAQEIYREFQMQGEEG
jgi:DNA-binding MurR/RpiR family transcriptional regulator